VAGEGLLEMIMIGEILAAEEDHADDLRRLLETLG